MRHSGVIVTRPATQSYGLSGLNLWNFYKGLGFRYIDVGISTEAG